MGQRLLETLIQRHPLLTYYVLAFAISWGGILPVAGPGGIPATPEQFKTKLFIVALAMMPGPSVVVVSGCGLKLEWKGGAASSALSSCPTAKTLPGKSVIWHQPRRRSVMKKM